MTPLSEKDIDKISRELNQIYKVMCLIDRDLHKSFDKSALFRVSLIEFSKVLKSLGIEFHDQARHENGIVTYKSGSQHPESPDDAWDGIK